MDYQKELEKIAAGEAANPQQPYRSLIPFILTQEELSMQDLPPREFLLSEWMPKDSFGMVYAPRGVGKSWFCMALAVAVSEGKKRFLGWDLHAQHDVLYVDGEMAQVDLKERFEGLCAGPNPRLHILASEMLYREGKPLIILAVETVMWLGEMRKLNWDDWEPEKQTLFLRNTKNGSSRLIPLNDNANAALQTLTKSHQRILPTNYEAVKSAWRRLCSLAGIEKLRFHDLRHEAISRNIPAVGILENNIHGRNMF
jgi:hypothetical protein